MLTKTEGIVFRRIPYSETSIICDIYTSEHGLMSYIISGVRKPKARTSASLLQVMSIVDLLAYHSDSNKLHRIREIRPAYVFQTMPMDVRKNAIILFMAELCSKCIKEHEQNMPLYQLIHRTLVDLDEKTSGFQNHHLKFMIQLADELGFGPVASQTPEAFCFDMIDGLFTAELPSTHQYYREDEGELAQLIKYARDEGDEPQIDRQRRNGLIDDLIIYYKVHLENLKEFNSHLILREVL